MGDDADRIVHLLRPDTSRASLIPRTPCEKGAIWARVRIDGYHRLQHPLQELCTTPNSTE